jgi:hypothetical protein
VGELGGAAVHLAHRVHSVDYAFGFEVVGAVWFWVERKRIKDIKLIIDELNYEFKGNTMFKLSNNTLH